MEKSERIKSIFGDIKKALNDLRVSYNEYYDNLTMTADIHEDKTVIRLIISIDPKIENLSVKAKLADGTEWIIPSEKFEQTQTHVDRYYVYFNGLNSGLMSEPVYFTVYEGNKAVSNTLSYSIESYAYSQENKATVDEALLKLLKAMMRYGDAAYNYVN